jgi:hypothetical protein
MNWNLIFISLFVLLALLFAQRLIGARWASFASCMPLTSAPLAVAASIEFGTESAQTIILGCISATGAAAIAIFSFAYLARRPLWLALATAMLSFAACVLAQNQADISAAIGICLAFVLVLATAWSSRRLRSKTDLRAGIVKAAPSSKNTVVLPSLILFICIASTSILPPTWSGILSASPLIGLCFLTSLRQKSYSSGALQKAASAANQGLLTKLIFFAFAYYLVNANLHWLASYLLAAAIALVCLVIIEAANPARFKKRQALQTSPTH